MVIRVPRTRRNPHQLALPLLPTTYQLTNLLLCLVPTFVMVCLLSSFLVVLPGRLLVCGTVASSLVLGLIVWLLTPLILRLAKFILLHLMETDQLSP